MKFKDNKRNLAPQPKHGIFWVIILVILLSVSSHRYHCLHSTKNVEIHMNMEGKYPMDDHKLAERVANICMLNAEIPIERRAPAAIVTSAQRLRNREHIATRFGVSPTFRSLWSKQRTTRPILYLKIMPRDHLYRQCLHLLLNGPHCKSSSHS